VHSPSNARHPNDWWMVNPYPRDSLYEQGFGWGMDLWRPAVPSRRADVGCGMPLRHCAMMKTRSRVPFGTTHIEGPIEDTTQRRCTGAASHVIEVMERS
jgi:hypothetical protein